MKVRSDEGHHAMKTSSAHRTVRKAAQLTSYIGASAAARGGARLPRPGETAGICVVAEAVIEVAGPWRRA